MHSLPFRVRGLVRHDACDLEGGPALRLGRAFYGSRVGAQRDDHAAAAGTGELGTGRAGLAGDARDGIENRCGDTNGLKETLIVVPRFANRMEVAVAKRG